MGTTPERAEQYCRRALAGLHDELAAAGPGERNRVLFRVAARAASLAAGLALDWEPISGELAAAALALGLAPHEVRSTLTSAARAGFASPAVVAVDKKTGPHPAHRRPTTPHQRAATPVSARPPRAALDALWAAAHPPGLTLAPAPRGYLDGCSYLQSRGWWPPAVGALDLVRILPADYPWPPWWPWGSAARWTVAALLFEPDGTPASITARAVETPGWPLPPDKPKARSPRGYSTRELLLADRAGLALLRGEGPPPAGVLLAEGLTDTLALALYAAKKRERLAVLGLVAGSAPALARVAWPPGTTVICFTDLDAAGENYAAAALAALPETVTFLRGRLPYAPEA